MTFHHTPAYAVRALAVACVLIGVHTTVHGTERVVNQYDTRNGLPVAHVLSLAQDARGFIWIGTMGGLVRFDGHDMRQWLPETLRGEILDIAPLPNDKLLVRTHSTILEVDEKGARAQVGENNSPLTSVTGVAVTQDGTAWAGVDGVLMMRTPAGSWRPTPAGWFGGAPVGSIRVSEAKDLLIIAGESLWTLQSERPALIAHVPGLFEARAWAGRYFALTFDDKAGRIVEVGHARESSLLSIDGARPMALARRGDVTWAAFDRYLVALRPGRSPEVITSHERLPSGGPLLVDAEGSLWIGTSRGLLQFPEPETRSWTDVDGLPSAHTRSLMSTPEGMWVSTWQGLGRLVPDSTGWKGVDAQLYHASQLCLDGRGALIVMDQPNGALLTRETGRFVSHPAPGREWLAGCAASRSGGVWYATDHSLWFVSEAARTARAVVPPPGGNGAIYHAVLEDTHERLWLTQGEAVCHADARILRSDGRADWRCDAPAGIRTTNALTETSSGAIWAGTQDAGVWRWSAGAWLQIPATRQLPSNTIRGFARVADGTIWVLGAGIVVRVREEANDAGWSVVERLTSSQGLPSEVAESLVEEEDGSVWIATMAGVTMVPASARQTVLPAPRLELVTAVVNGRATPIDRPLQMTAGDNSVELRFAVLTYRDRRRLQLQLRLHPDEPWTESKLDDPTMRFVNLGAGAYTVEARASLDGVSWSTPARLVVNVGERWYRTSWAMALAALGLLGLGAIVHRTRLAVATQLGRQRSRIARDLHDELGSGLGSIGILASVAAASHMAEPQRQTMAATIADTAQELSGGLSDLVWSLSSRPVTMAALAAHLAERGSRLIPGPRPRFETRFPSSWPPDDLPLLVRRNVILIGLEALRNAARHADASIIWIRLAPDPRSTWMLEVGDDGCGLRSTQADAADDAKEGGHGRENMSARAADIGAQLHIESTEGLGTVVRLNFRPALPRGAGGFFRRRARPVA